MSEPQTLKTPAKKKQNAFGYGMCNPVIRKMAKETGKPHAESQAAGYQGITLKTVWLLMMCVVGVTLFFLFHPMFLNSASADTRIYVTDLDDLTGIFVIDTTVAETLVFGAVALVTLILPFLAFFIKATIPVTGTLYALCEGYFVGMFSAFLCDDYKWISMVAFVITAVIVGTLLFLYAKKIVRVGKKFRTVIFAVFIGSVFSSLVFFGLSFIPAVRPFMAAIFAFMGNPVVSIVLSVVYLILAVLFLLADFDAIKECVENQMPKKYEWLAAFGLAYSIIYIYFKIINIIIQIAAENNNK